MSPGQDPLEATTQALAASVRSQQDTALVLAKVEVKLERLIQDLSKLDGDKVSRDEFDPIKRLVYGVVSIILVTVAGAILALVVNRPGP